MKVEFYKHNIGDTEKESVLKTLDSIFLTTGPKTKEFEKIFAEYLKVTYCVGVTSWTMGGLITLKALGIGPGDEVITTPLTFIATANIILEVGAKPVFVDVEKDTGNIDVSKIEATVTGNTKAILPVHLYGQMCDMVAINNIAKKYNLFVIEDCAHCIEGERDGIKPGQLSTAAVFSFYATKNITCGEGGAIVTNNKKLYANLLSYRLHGMSKSAADRYNNTYQHWDMELLGYKCNMNDIQAAMLIPQLDKIEEILKLKEQICQRYETAFSKLDGIDFPKVLSSTKHARHVFTIWVDPNKRDYILQELQDAHIGVAVNFRAIHLLSYYKNNFGFQPSDYPVSEKIGNSTITIPMYTKITSDELEYVITTVAGSIEK